MMELDYILTRVDYKRFLDEMTKTLAQDCGAEWDHYRMADITDSGDDSFSLSRHAAYCEQLEVRVRSISTRIAMYFADKHSMIAAAFWGIDDEDTIHAMVDELIVQMREKDLFSKSLREWDEIAEARRWCNTYEDIRDNVLRNARAFGCEEQVS